MVYTREKGESRKGDSQTVELPEKTYQGELQSKHPLTVSITGEEDWLQAHAPEAEGIEGVVVFEPGDTLPLAVVEEVYPSFQDIIVLENGNGKPLDSELA